MWSVVIALENIQFKRVSRLQDSDITVILKSLNIRDETNPRFADIMTSKFNENQKDLIEIKLLRQEKQSPRYENEDFVIDLNFGQF